MARPLLTRLFLASCAFSPVCFAARPSDSSIPEIQRDFTKYHIKYPDESVYGRYDWFAAGQDLLNKAIKDTSRINNNVAKNVIIFIGDGMGLASITAARIYKAQKTGLYGYDNLLEWDKFPYVALSRTHSANRQTVDSAGSGTAMMTGEKVQSATLGVSWKVNRTKCETAFGNELKTILDHSQAEGKRVGIVSTARLTHATPAATYAAVVDRAWEYHIPDEVKGDQKCKDIAQQLVDDNQYVNVAMGGGRAYFTPTTEADPEYTDKMGSRKDGRNLIQEWLDKKKADSKVGDDQYKYVYDKKGFEAVDANKVDYLLGMFEPGHMQYELDRDNSKEPHLSELVEKTIKILKRGDKGFFLLVEGARIDHAHHANNAARALADTLSMEAAVKKAMSLTSEEDTLLIVTADHSLVFSVGGYPTVDSPVLGLSDAMASGSFNPLALDGKPYLILGYLNGPGFYDHRWDWEKDVEVPRANLSAITNDTTHKDFLQDAGTPFADGNHAGEDVAIYARGPMSYLFHGSHEQNYIGHVMMYASCVGPNKKHCEEGTTNPAVSDPASGGATIQYVLPLLIISTLLSVTFFA